MTASQDTLLGTYGISDGGVLAGKFRVERVLGRGGMGVVVAARHLRLDARVALKFLLPDLAQDPQSAARFLREARAAARLRGEHVARVMDVGELDSGLPYLVMEYLDGADLGTMIREHGCPPVDVAASYLMQACEALDEAHAAGIVHRDIKPSNLFVTRRPNGTACIKVLDFGISKLASSPATSSISELTATQTMLGSPFYMSPEQLRTPRDVDPRSDIWSLGATAYELLSGSVPFRGDTIAGLCFAIVGDAPVSIRALRTEVPEALEAVVLRCLSKESRGRFASARDLARSLAPFASATPSMPASGSDTADRGSSKVPLGSAPPAARDVYAPVRRDPMPGAWAAPAPPMPGHAQSPGGPERVGAVAAPTRAERAGAAGPRAAPPARAPTALGPGPLRVETVLAPGVSELESEAEAAPPSHARVDRPAVEAAAPVQASTMLAPPWPPAAPANAGEAPRDPAPVAPPSRPEPPVHTGVEPTRTPEAARPGPELAGRTTSPVSSEFAPRPSADRSSSARTSFLRSRWPIAGILLTLVGASVAVGVTRSSHPNAAAGESTPSASERPGQPVLPAAAPSAMAGPQIATAQPAAPTPAVSLAPDPIATILLPQPGGSPPAGALAAPQAARDASVAPVARETGAPAIPSERARSPVPPRPAAPPRPGKGPSSDPFADPN